MTYTNHTDPKQNPLYPRLASDLADALIDELDESQVRRLFDELRATDLAAWLGWFEQNGEAIYEYGCLTPTQRKRRSQTPGDTAALRLHHALIFAELWRARTHESHYHFPPYGPVPDNQEDQLKLMLGILRSYNQFEPHDLWPFEVPQGVDFFPLFPFRDD